MHGDEEAGQYRRIQNYVGDPARIKYTPCPPSEVPTRMREYVNKLQADMAENVKIKEQSDYDWSRVFHTLAQHHIEFEKIHPFIDGNGRTGRLLLTYEMLSMGFCLLIYAMRKERITMLRFLHMTANLNTARAKTARPKKWLTYLPKANCAVCRRGSTLSALLPLRQITNGISEKKFLTSPYDYFSFYYKSLIISFLPSTKLFRKYLHCASKLIIYFIPLFLFATNIKSDTLISWAKFYL